MAASIGVFLWGLSIEVFDLPPYLVASPQDVLASFRTDWELLLTHLWPTLIESLLGFLAGNVFAACLAVSFVHSRTLERSLFPLAVVLKTIPIVALAPILVLMLGYGYAPKIVIAALITFFPTLVNLTRGLRSVDPQLLELMQLFSADRREVFWKLRARSALPYLFAALKIAAPNAVIGAIVAEWIGSREGLGFLIIEATHNFRTPLLYSTMIVSSLLAFAFLGAVTWLERVALKWAPESGGVA